MKKDTKKLQEEIKELKQFLEKIRDDAGFLIYGEQGKKKGRSVEDDLREELEELKELIAIDGLTGVLNRRGFYERFNDLFKEALFSKESPSLRKQVNVQDFSILFIDIDNFKKINDKYSHDEGDQVLKSLGELLQSTIRSLDGVARFGGEEFVVALVGANEEIANNKAKEIRKTITEKLHITKDNKKKITASIGVASLQESDADDFDELIGYADKAMYEAKTNRGKDTVVKYSEIT